MANQLTYSQYCERSSVLDCGTQQQELIVQTARSKPHFTNMLHSIVKLCGLRFSNIIVIYCCIIVLLFVQLFTTAHGSVFRTNGVYAKMSISCPRIQRAVPYYAVYTR